MVGRQMSPLIPRGKSAPKTKTTTATSSAARRKSSAAEEEKERYVGANGRKTRYPHGIRPSAPQQQLSTEDKRAIRRRRQRRRAILRVIIVAAIGTLAVMAWLNWDVMAPDKLWVKVQDMIGGGVGSYPVDLSGTNAHYLIQNDHYTVVLTDSHLIYLNEKGAEVSRYGCSFAEPLLCTKGNYVLAAEQKGQRLLLTTRNHTVLSKTIDCNIRSVDINSRGQMAVLTDGPQGYAVQLRVFDRFGKTLYTRNSNRMATDVAISPNGSTVSMVSVEATDGTLSSRMEVYDLTSTAPEAKYAYTEEGLLYRAEYLSNGKLVTVSEAGVVLMDVKKGETTAYKPEGMRMLGYAVGGDTLAVAMRPYGDTAGGDLAILSADGKVKSSAPFTGEFRHLSGHKGRYALLTDTFVQPFSLSGVGEPIGVEGDGRQAIVNPLQVVLMGLNRLEAYAID